MRTVSLVCTALWVAGLFCAKAAPGRGDEVIVIYNTRVPESKEVADYYAEKRHVPKDQIFGYALTTEDDISRSEFRDSLQKPLAKKLADKKLWHVGSHIVRATNNQPEHVEWRVDESKIHYAVLCYGMPLRISEDENHTEPGLDKIRPEFRRNLAEVESELAWLPLLEGRPPLAGPM